jgi:hypothetical protein
MNTTPEVSAEEITALIESMEREIHFDCHRTETAFNRSRFKHQLVDVGPAVLGPLATLIQKRFPNFNTSTLPKESVDWNLFGIYVWLIGNIQEKYHLPTTPYGSDTCFGDQDIGAWFAYCIRIQT